MGLVSGSHGCGCIAHHAALIDSGTPPRLIDWIETSAKRLEITCAKAEAICLVPCWPKKFKEAHDEAWRNRKSTVPVAIRRINHFIKTGK